jgi:iron-sulfur cluster repair protein YtfE (RIC family)
MKDLKNMNVGDIVTDDYRAAEVFKKYGIDYCCGGHQSLEQAASEKKLDIAELELKLSHLDEVKTNRQLNYKDWNPGFLCDYIVNEFHNKVYRVLPELMAYLDKLEAYATPRQICVRISVVEPFGIENSACLRKFFILHMMIADDEINSFAFCINYLKIIFCNSRS